MQDYDLLGGAFKVVYYELLFFLKLFLKDAKGFFFLTLKFGASGLI